MTDHTQSTGELEAIFKKYNAPTDNLTTPEAIDAIQALIRTEAYRLAAEVIGEDEALQPWNENMPDAFERNTDTLKRNRFRAEQRERLQSLVKEGTEK